MKIDHIAIAVNDLESAMKQYQEALGVKDVEFETVETEGVKVGILHLENGRIELMEPPIFSTLSRYFHTPSSISSQRYSK